MKRLVISRLFKETSWSVLLKIFHALCSFLITVILARKLGPKGYGIYAYAYAFVTLFSVPLQAGLPPLVVRETAKNIAKNRPDFVLGVWRWATQIAIFISLIFVLIAFSVLFFLKDWKFDLELQTFLWAFLLVPISSLGNLRGAALRGLRKVLIGQIPEFLFRPLLFLLFLSVEIFILSRKVTPPNAMALNVMASLFAFLIGTWFLWRALESLNFSNVKPSFAYREWLLSLFPLAFIAGMWVINSQTDIVMLRFFESPFHVGIYRVAIQMALFSSFALQAVNMVVAPRFAFIYARSEMEKLQNLAIKASCLVFVFSFVVAVFFAFYGKNFLVLVFGKSFSLAYVPLLILLLGQLVNSMVGSVGMLLNMTGYEKDTALGLAISAVLNVLLNLILIPKFSMAGAAAATSISMIVWNLLLWCLVWKRLGIDSSVFRLFLIRNGQN